MKNKLSFVVDTNVLISALLVESGTPQKAFLKASQNGYLLFSQATFSELREVL